MKSITLHAFVLALCLGFIPSIGQAKYSNPESNPWHLTTVSYLRAHPHDGQYVVLIGRVTEDRGDKDYYFTDGTGRITLDSSKKLPVGKMIVVRGHLDQDWIGFGKDELNVKSWRYDSKKEKE